MYLRRILRKTNVSHPQWSLTISAKSSIIVLKLKEVALDSKQMFVKIGVLENVANLIGKRLCWSLFIRKFQAWRPVTLLKRDSNTGAFRWNLRIFKITFLYRPPLVAASVTRPLDGFLKLFHDFFKSCYNKN